MSNRTLGLGGNGGDFVVVHVVIVALFGLVASSRTAASRRARPRAFVVAFVFLVASCRIRPRAIAMIVVDVVIAGVVLWLLLLLLFVFLLVWLLLLSSSSYMFGIQPAAAGPYHASLHRRDRHHCCP